MSTDLGSLNAARLGVELDLELAAGRRGPNERLLTADAERRLFQGVRRRMVGHLIGSAVRQSRLRLSLVILLTLMLWMAMFCLFADGFRFLAQTMQDPSTHAETVRLLFSLFFASLTAMLVFSTGILLFGALFRSDEVRFLLTQPVSDERIFLFKFQESLLFSSWAFLLLASPMLLAYGMTAGTGWGYYVLLLPYLVCFAFIPGSIGAIGCLVVVRYLAGTRWTLSLPVLALSGIAALAGARLLVGELENDLLTAAWFQEILGRLRFADYRLLPNWWLSTGLLELANADWDLEVERRAWHEGLMFLALLFSNALFFQLVAIQSARALLRSGYSRLHGSGPQRRRAAAAVPWPAPTGAWFPARLRLLVNKDLRLFRRDPVQWSQFLIFLSLLSLYFVNVRRLTFDVEYAMWVNMISFLNLAIIGLIQSTFTTRFVFPLISLEGRRFWILSLLPIRRDDILWGKFWFAAVGSWIPCAALVCLSDLMLGVSADLLLIHLFVCTLLCSGLSGLAVGLGARFPDLRHDSPARIAAGFGGTMTLMLSTAYIMSIVMLAAAPYHFEPLLADAGSLFGDEPFQLWWLVGLAASTVLGVCTTVAPMWLGLRAFRELEC